MVLITLFRTSLQRFDKQRRNYSPIEECLALILAMEHFNVYLGTTVHPLLVFTDHNPHLHPSYGYGFVIMGTGTGMGTRP